MNYTVTDNSGRTTIGTFTDGDIDVGMVMLVSPLDTRVDAATIPGTGGNWIYWGKIGQIEPRGLPWQAVFRWQANQPTLLQTPYTPLLEQQADTIASFTDLKDTVSDQQSQITALSNDTKGQEALAEATAKKVEGSNASNQAIAAALSTGWTSIQDSLGTKDNATTTAVVAAVVFVLWSMFKE